jgi:proteasome accessory factor A
MTLAHELDWVAKFQIMDAYRQRDNAAWNDSRIETVDIQYADLRADKGLGLILQKKGRMRTLFTEEQIGQAVVNPPEDTRAYFRGKCVANYEAQIAAASWDSVIFDLGLDQPMVRLNTVDARKGSRELTEKLFAQKLSASDFVSLLSQ